MITTRWWTVWWNSLRKFWTPPGILLIICPQWSCLFMTLKIMNIILLIWARVIITLLKDISLKEKYQIQYELHLRWTSTKYNMWIWFMLAVLEASKVFFLIKRSDLAVCTTANLAHFSVLDLKEPTTELGMTKKWPESHMQHGMLRRIQVTFWQLQ